MNAHHRVIGAMALNAPLLSRTCSAKEQGERPW